MASLAPAMTSSSHDALHADVKSTPGLASGGAAAGDDILVVDGDSTLSLGPDSLLLTSERCPTHVVWSHQYFWEIFGL